MKNYKAQHRLPIVLAQITTKLFSSAFIKLMLAHNNQEQDQTHIRHYDIQCEAIITITNTLNHKLNLIQLKFFTRLRDALNQQKKENLSNFRRKKTLNVVEKTIEPILQSQLKLQFRQNENSMNAMNSNTVSSNRLVRTKAKTMSMQVDRNGRTANQYKKNKRALIMSKLADLQSELCLMATPIMVTPTFGSHKSQRNSWCKSYTDKNGDWKKFDYGCY